MRAPVFPPLFTGQDATGSGAVVALAAAAARAGVDAGTVVYDLAAGQIAAAIVFAPEVPLARAAMMLPVCGVGFQNALGALAPPEVGVHLGWDGTILINGGRAGALTLLADRADRDAVPGWLVIALHLQLWPENDETGLMPDDTTLFAEGCGDVEPVELLEAWVRHSLVWLNTWDQDGAAALHREWSGLAHGIGTDMVVAGQAGHVLGVDEDFGLLLKQDAGTQLIPLTDLLKDTP